jgi:hypothetical protein
MTSVDDIDKLLNREASAFQRDLEVDRILNAFKLNPYDVFDLDGKATPEEIKKKYRQISLCKHPFESSLPFAKASKFDAQHSCFASSLHAFTPCSLLTSLSRRVDELG